jgi:hypothetical protein
MNSRPIELDKQLLHRIAVARLFHEITDDLGLVEAQQIFATFCVPMTAKERADLKNTKLLLLYDTMLMDDWKTPARNVQRLARHLAEANKQLPREDRYGPSGSTDPIVLDKHIRRLINKRKAERLARRM